MKLVYSGYWDDRQIILVQVGEILAWMNHFEKTRPRQRVLPQKVGLRMFTVMARECPFASLHASWEGLGLVSFHHFALFP